jgi:hypothetical protein
MMDLRPGARKTRRHRLSTGRFMPRLTISHRITRQRL